jgi:hypothetical protein
MNKLTIEITRLRYDLWTVLDDEKMVSFGGWDPNKVIEQIKEHVGDEMKELIAEPLVNGVTYPS